MALYFKALFTNTVLLIFYLRKVRGYPKFSFWISITLVKICFSRIFSKQRKNTFELVGTALKEQTIAAGNIQRQSSTPKLGFASASQVYPNSVVSVTNLDAVNTQDEFVQTALMGCL